MRRQARHVLTVLEALRGHVIAKGELVGTFTQQGAPST
jgi:hypothetical protein